MVPGHLGLCTSCILIPGPRRHIRTVSLARIQNTGKSPRNEGFRWEGIWIYIYIFFVRMSGAVFLWREMDVFKRNNKCLVMIKLDISPRLDFLDHSEFSTSVRTACWVEAPQVSSMVGYLRIGGWNFCKVIVVVPLSVHVSLSLSISSSSIVISALIPRCAGTGGWTACWRRKSRRTRSGQCWRWPAGRAGSA